MICKIWGIKAKYNKNGEMNVFKTLKDPMDYISDDKKIAESQENKNVSNFSSVMENLDQEILHINNEDSLSSVIEYMSNKNKIKKIFKSGYLCDPDFAIEQWIKVKEKNLSAVNKELSDDTGNQAFHIVQSFPRDLDISDDEIHQCGIELAKKLGIHQAIICSHLQPEYDVKANKWRGMQKHNHILINSHIYSDFIDPEHPERMKYHDCKDSYAQLRMWNDEIAIAHGFPIIIENPLDVNAYDWYISEEENQGKSWKHRISMDIDNAMRVTSSWNEYLNLMKEYGYNIREGKHTTYTAPDGTHKARGSSLGKEYTKEYLETYWEQMRAVREDAEQEVNYNKQEFSSLERMQAVLSSDIQNYYIKIQRPNQKFQGKFYVSYLPFTLNSTVKDKYIKDDSSYEICNKNHDILLKVKGATLLSYLSNIKSIKKDVTEQETVKGLQQNEHLQRQQELKEQIKIENVEQEKKKKQEKYQFWINTKTKKPYVIGQYDEYGRKRSVLEHILILAIVVITNETPDFVNPIPKDLQLTSNEKQTLFFAAPSWKVERLLESITIARKEGIHTPEELALALNLVGKETSKAKGRVNRIIKVIKKMQPLYEAVESYENLKDFCEEILNLPDGPEKTQKSEVWKDTLLKYNSAKATLYHYKMFEGNKIQEFKVRWESVNKDKEIRLSDYEEATKHYQSLKKLKYQVALAEKREYCYGTLNFEKNEKEQKLVPRNIAEK